MNTNEINTVKNQPENDLTFGLTNKIIKNSKKKIEIVDFEQAPEYLKDNEFIKTGYLVNCNSFEKAFRSLFLWHNETINIWSHLIGTIVAIVLIFYTTSLIGDLKKNLLSEFDYEQIVLDIKEIIQKFLSLLNQDIITETNNSGTLINNYIKNINTKSNYFLLNMGDRYKIIKTVNQYIYSIQNLIEKIYDRFHYISDNNVKTNINLGWDICKNKLLDILRGDIKDKDNQLLIDEENPRHQWPLYIMLTAAIILLGFSSLCHLFGSISKNAYKFLSHFEYTGIIFLIAGSCYPPYYYYFYCESCKYYFLFNLLL